MNFKKHLELEGKHAFLSPSGYHWINYDLLKLSLVFRKRLATERGTRLHALAKDLIELGVPLPRSKKTLNMYVNDALLFGMTPEQPLKYSDNCFGTADTLSFDTIAKFLRIHDYKSGETPASMHQLEIYVALFCLEYCYNPFDIKVELRIYQNNEKIIYSPAPETIQNIIDSIILFDKEIEKIKSEE